LHEIPYLMFFLRLFLNSNSPEAWENCQCDMSGGSHINDIIFKQFRRKGMAFCRSSDRRAWQTGSKPRNLVQDSRRAPTTQKVISVEREASCFFSSAAIGSQSAFHKQSSVSATAILIMNGMRRSLTSLDGIIFS
jgi:hypothetical protein